jgi:hypothetical protein
MAQAEKGKIDNTAFQLRYPKTALENARRLPLVGIYCKKKQIHPLGSVFNHLEYARRSSYPCIDKGNVITGNFQRDVRYIDLQ